MALAAAHYLKCRELPDTLRQAVLATLALVLGHYLREAALTEEHQVAYAILIASLLLVFICIALILQWQRSLLLRFALLGILGVVSGLWFYRFVMPMPMVVVGPYFEEPVEVQGFEQVRAEECGACHPRQYQEWRQSYHSKAYRNPVFQAELKVQAFTDSCGLCHSPLRSQIEAPANDPFRYEGVTCLGCHSRGRMLVGRHQPVESPHPVAPISEPNEICVRCHVASQETRGIIPCGAVAEEGSFGYEWEVTDWSRLRCVQCHMLNEAGEVTHRFPGGRDPEMLRKALSFDVHRDASDLVVEVRNVGALHKVPTGVPGRRLVIRVLSGNEALEEAILQRTQVWRPLVFTFSDNRPGAGQRRSIRFRGRGGDASLRVQAVYQRDDPARFRRVMGRDPTVSENEILVFEHP